MKGEVVMTSDSQKGEESSTPKSAIEYDIRTILCAPILGTAYGRKSRYPDRLNVAPGDIATVYYIDRFATGGCRNVFVCAPIPVGRAIYGFNPGR